MSLRKRQFTRDFKVQVLYEVETGESVARYLVSIGYLPHSLINRWQKRHRQYQGQAFSGNGNMYKYEAKITELERMVGQLTVDSDHGYRNTRTCQGI